MFSDDDLKGLHAFLRQTAEGNLKKILVGSRMTEVHLHSMLKIARAMDEEEFAVHWQAGTFPKVKFSPPESAIKETLYAVCAEACMNAGLITPLKKVA